MLMLPSTLEVIGSPAAAALVLMVATYYLMSSWEKGSSTVMFCESSGGAADDHSAPDLALTDHSDAVIDGADLALAQQLIDSCKSGDAAAVAAFIRDERQRNQSALETSINANKPQPNFASVRLTIPSTKADPNLLTRDGKPALGIKPLSSSRTGSTACRPRRATGLTFGMVRPTAQLVGTGWWMDRWREK